MIHIDFILAFAIGAAFVAIMWSLTRLIKNKKQDYLADLNIGYDLNPVIKAFLAMVIVVRKDFSIEKILNHDPQIIPNYSIETENTDIRESVFKSFKDAVTTQITSFFETGEASSIELDLEGRGKPRTIRINCFPMNQDRVIISFIDITEAKEQAIRTIRKQFELRQIAATQVHDKSKVAILPDEAADARLNSDEKETRKFDLSESEKLLIENDKQLQMAFAIGKVSPIMWDIQNDLIFVKVLHENGEIHSIDGEGIDFMIENAPASERETQRELLNNLKKGIINKARFETQIDPIDPNALHDQYYEVFLETVEKDHNGVPVKIIGIIQNITSKKSIEFEKQKQKEFFVNLINEIPIPIAVKNVEKDYQYVYWNKESERFFGKKAEEVIGHNDFDIFPQQQAVEIRKHDLQVTEEEKTYNYEIVTTEEKFAKINKALVTDSHNDNNIVVSCLDITELAQSQEAIKKQNQQLELVLKAGNIIFLFYDVEKGIVSIVESENKLNNPNIIENIIEETSDIKNLLAKVNSEDRILLETQIKLLLNGKIKNFKQQVRYDSKEDHDSIYEIHVLADKTDSNGNVITAVATAQNITERRVITQELNVNKALLNEIVDNMSVSVAVKDVDNDFKYILWNKMSEKFFERREEDVLGKNDFEIFGEEIGRNNLKKDKEITELSEGISYQKKIIRKDGSVFNSLVNEVMFQGYGKRLIVVSHLDITNLTKLQAELNDVNTQLRLSLMTEKIVPIVWDCIQNEFKISIPEFATSVDKLSSKEEIVSFNSFIKSVHPDDRESVKEKLAEIQSGATNHVHFEMRFDFRGKYDRYYNIHLVVQEKTKDDKSKRIFGAMQDITEQRKASIKLQEAKEKAENSDKLKSAFLANMSHEIRTPLNAIIGFSELLSMSDDEKEKQEYMEIITANNNLMLVLVDNILDLSKLEADTMEYSFSNVNVNLMMREIERKFNEDSTVNKKIELVFEETEPKCVVVTEKNRVKQVIFNFLSNAYKFTKEGKISFGFNVKDNKIRFYVSDTGIGVSPGEQELIFERYYKSNNFTSGAGLGLAISKEIVRKLNGTIGINSELGKGATFWFEIPVEFVNTEQKKTAEKQDIKKEESKRRKKLILVAEDMLDNYKLIQVKMESKYNIVHAWNGYEAVNLFDQHQPDAILMDIKMPGMDGYEATSIIRGKDANVPIIAVTAYAYAEDKDKIMKSGFNDFVTKPVDMDKVFEILEKFEV
ncbi:MAG: PAS domain S-box protein [Lentimicrobiaceae bacterium]|jgi:PAS domain S-box-containing protein|nr:PAS domain S-box protein [Lentimicrobiaceae bacterium]